MKTRIGPILINSWKIFWTSRSLVGLALLVSVSLNVNLPSPRSLGIGLALLTIPVTIAFGILSIVSTIGFVRRAIQILAVRSRSRQPFSENFRYFWRFIGLSLLTIPGLLLVVGYLLLPNPGSPYSLLCIIPLIILGIPVAFLSLLLEQMSTIAVVAKDLTVNKAVEQSIKIFDENRGFWLKLSLVLIMGNLTIGQGFSFLFSQAINLNSSRHLIEGNQTIFSSLSPQIVITWLVYVILYGMTYGFFQTAWVVSFSAVGRKTVRVKKRRASLAKR